MDSLQRRSFQAPPVLSPAVSCLPPWPHQLSPAESGQVYKIRSRVLERRRIRLRLPADEGSRRGKILKKCFRKDRGFIWLQVWKEAGRSGFSSVRARLLPPPARPQLCRDKVSRPFITFITLGVLFPRSEPALNETGTIG